MPHEGLGHRAKQPHISLDCTQSAFMAGVLLCDSTDLHARYMLLRKQVLLADLALPASRALCVQDRAQLSLEQQLKVIALRHDLLAKMDEILQDRKRMIATLQVCTWPPVQFCCSTACAFRWLNVLDREAVLQQCCCALVTTCEHPCFSNYPKRRSCLHQDIASLEYFK